MSRKLSYKEVKDFIEKEGYLLVSTEYTDIDSLLETKCGYGHNYFVSYYHFRTSGSRCIDCSGLRKKTFQQAKELFEKEGFILLDCEYSNTHVPIRVQCKKGHIFFPTYKTFKAGHRCPDCAYSGGTSKPERELLSILKQHFPELIKKGFRVKIPNKSHIKWFQIDGYHPKIRRGIELDGTYYHSEKVLVETRTKRGWSVEDAKNYHTIKDNALKNCHGIEVLHIKEEDWKANKQACIDKCLAFLGLEQKKVA